MIAFFLSKLGAEGRAIFLFLKCTELLQCNIGFFGQNLPILKKTCENQRLACLWALFDSFCCIVIESATFKIPLEEFHEDLFCQAA